MKSKKIAENFKEIMKTLGLDLKNKSLKGTPDRVGKMFSQEIFYGLDEKNFPKIMTVPNDKWVNYDGILLEKNIKLHSICEHHFMPIIWVAHVAYIPKDKIIGLSKINRIVDFFAKKPQIQERLTEEIFSKFKEILATEDVAVILDASHTCVSFRGVKDQNSITITSKFWGVFRKWEKKRELMDLILL